MSDWTRIGRRSVRHKGHPRMIVRFSQYGIGKPKFLDSEAGFIADELQAGREPAMTLARLMREAGDHYFAVSQQTNQRKDS